MKTSDLIGPALDWAVAKCEGFWFGDVGHEQYALYQPHKYGPAMSAQFWKPSTDWSQGGTLIERERISVISDYHEIEEGWLAEGYDNKVQAFGPTPLISAMRCFVASKLGDEVEIPEELQ